MQRRMRGGKDAHIHGDDPVAAHAHNFLGFQHAQQAGLHGQSHAAYLVQKKGALVGQLKQALLAALARPGERALLVSEKFAFQQVFRQGRAVDGHKGFVIARAGHMQRMGHQFLAAACFSEDEHRGVRGGVHAHFSLQQPHGGAVTVKIIQIMLGDEAALMQILADLQIHPLQRLHIMNENHNAAVFGADVHRKAGDEHLAVADVHQHILARPGIGQHVRHEQLFKKRGKGVAALHIEQAQGHSIGEQHLAVFADKKHALLGEGQHVFEAVDPVLLHPA